MVQKYINATSRRGAVITRSTAVSTAKALMRGHPKLVGKIDLDKSEWAKSLFQRMGFICRKDTSSKLVISVDVKKKSGLLFHDAFVEKIEKHSTRDSLVINFNQTTTLTKHNTKQVYVKGSNDKRAITATFTVTLEGQFLGMQLIYGRKSNQRLPNVKFPEEFLLSINPKHHSNEKESLKFINEILVPYIQQKRAKLNAPNQQALAIFDVFKGQVTQAVLNLFDEHNIAVTFVSANMTHLFQPLDLTINSYAKNYLKRKLNGLYTDQVYQQYEEKKEIEGIDVKLRLTTLKPLHAEWMTELYNHFKSKYRGKTSICICLF